PPRSSFDAYENLIFYRTAVTVLKWGPGRLKKQKSISAIPFHPLPVIKKVANFSCDGDYVNLRECSDGHHYHSG
ncbi:MAG: hypothetical protein ACXVB1_03965, partial [Pseudobdellovibrionaceae bacterium]